ncbi:phage tail protein I [bacterium]|nr:phage tail protein I [bacterium]MBR5554860.1 phage tail protein I [bacterium]
MSKNSLAPINDVNLKIFDEICEERFAKLNLDSLLVSIIDNVPADALPHLAEQYHITGDEGWLQALSDTEKRNLIKSSIKMHRYKGTKYALEEIFKTLNIVGNIEEWFNYGGNPYHFKVILQIFNRSINEETETKLRALIDEYKNERSWLEEIQFHLSTLARMHTYAALIEEETITINSRSKNG